MRLTRTVLGAVAAAALVLSGCGGEDATDTGQGATASESPDAEVTNSTAGAGPGAVGLATRDSELGEIVVDGEGRTVYVFTEDSPGAGTSACTGDCATTWPAVPAGTDVDESISAEVGEITGVDGDPQATLAGQPLYYYAEDTEAGDLNGQGVGSSWWVLAPDGTQVTATASPEAEEGPGY